MSTGLHITLLKALLSGNKEAMNHTCLDWLDDALDQCIEGKQGYVVLDETQASQLEGLPLIGDGEESLPWVLETHQQERRLYVGRHWQAKQSYVRALTERMKQDDCAFSATESVRLILDEGQYSALTRALKSRFHLITGGPGSGKTHVAAQILSEYLKHNPQSHIGVCAPTGKAVNRIKNAFEQMHYAAQLKITTLHQLLKVDAAFSREAEMLPYDLVVVDEASMLSSEMAAGLLSACRYVKHLVWLGDVNQLPSIEAGQVMEDVLAHCESNVSYLRAQYRYGESEQLMSLATASLEQDWSSIRGLLGSAFQPLDEKAFMMLQTRLDEQMVRWERLKQQAQWDVLLMQLTQWMVLNPKRVGEQGLDVFNRYFVQRYQSHGIYPAIVRENDAQRGLFNGDMGVVVHSASGDSFYYLNADQTVSQCSMQGLKHDPAWMLTVHQAQGSEFDEVWLWVDDSTPAQLLSRKLIYTALTRARRSIWWFGSDALMQAAFQ